MTRRRWVLLTAAMTVCVFSVILRLAGDPPNPSELFAPPGSYCLTVDGRYVPTPPEERCPRTPIEKE